MNARDAFEAMVSELADTATRDYCAQLSPPIYLHLTPRGDCSFDPVLIRDGDAGEDAAGLQLGINEALPRHFERDQLRAWLWERMRRLPVARP